LWEKLLYTKHSSFDLYIQAYQAQTPNRDKFSVAMLSQDDRLPQLLRAGMKVFIV